MADDEILSKASPVLNDGPVECLVSWKGTDNEIISVGPFARDRAEVLVGVYGRMYPGQSCWIQPLPKEVDPSPGAGAARSPLCRGAAA
jgi:hypothetical protein